MTEASDWDSDGISDALPYPKGQWSSENEYLELTIRLSTQLGDAVERLAKRCDSIEQRLAAADLPTAGVAEMVQSVERLRSDVDSSLWALREHVELLAGPRADIQSLRAELSALRTELLERIEALARAVPPS